MTGDAQSLAERRGESVHATEALLFNLWQQKINSPPTHPPTLAFEVNDFCCSWGYATLQLYMQLHALSRVRVEDAPHTLERAESEVGPRRGLWWDSE
jgi:hypothetical protein